MFNQKGFAQIAGLLAILVIFIITIGSFLYLNQVSKTSSSIIGTKSTPEINVLLASPSSRIALSSPLVSLSAIEVWEMVGPSNVELLITDSLGRQSGYVLSKQSYVEDIPQSSYIYGGSITDPLTHKTMPSHPDFSINNPLNGDYQVQVIGKNLGKYSIAVYLTSGTGVNSKAITSSIDGNTDVNQIDKYSVSLPSGKIQKLNS